MSDWRKEAGFKNGDEYLYIYYTTEACMKIINLVKAHNKEIGWNMTVKPYLDGYLVEDVFVYPQKVTGGSITVNVPKWAIWKANLPEEVEANLYGQGHSHVSMPTEPSGVDINQQKEEVLTKGKGFYFFEIVNKQGYANRFFYDIDNKIYYDNSKIITMVKGLDEFIINSFDHLEASNGSK